MKTKLINAVIMAEDYQKVINWYKQIFHLEIIYEHSGEYHYTELGQDAKNIVGIAKATEMDHRPDAPRNNSAILQVQVDDIEALYEKVKEVGSEIRFGPSYEEGADFSYGSISDPEGNEVWIISNKVLKS